MNTSGSFSVNNQQPILVTGAHRSGTTWVGRMLAAGGETAYISEPLNVFHRPGVFRVPVRSWYTYINGANGSEYLSAFQELLDFRYHLSREILSIRSWKDFLRMGRDFHAFYVGGVRGQRVLLKDPFAVFSTPWFAQKLNCQVVITVRHPAAFANSLKRLNWPFDFHDLLGQPALMHDHLEEDRSQMESIRVDDLIGRAALLWRMIYRSVHAVRNLHPDFQVVRHEDLSLDPLAGYQALYKSLGLNFNEKARDMILNSSNSENPMELSKAKTHAVKLDSRASVNNWKKRLGADEIDRIRRMTEGVSELYYSDDEWK
jgi:hypothetical protein